MTEKSHSLKYVHLFIMVSTIAQSGRILHSDENKLEVKLMEDFFIGVVLEFQKQCTVQLRYRA